MKKIKKWLVLLLVLSMMFCGCSTVEDLDPKYKKEIKRVSGWQVPDYAVVTDFAVDSTEMFAKIFISDENFENFKKELEESHFIKRFDISKFSIKSHTNVRKIPGWKFSLEEVDILYNSEDHIRGYNYSIKGKIYIDYLYLLKRQNGYTAFFVTPNDYYEETGEILNYYGSDSKDLPNDF